MKAIFLKTGMSIWLINDSQEQLKNSSDEELSNIIIHYLSNQWTVLFAHSDWLLKPGIVSAIYLLVMFWIEPASFSFFLRNFLVLLSTGLVHTKTIIHLSVGEEWLISS